MKKKILTLLAALLLLVVGVLVGAPLFLKGKIADIIKNKVNNNINATLDFASADLSLLSNFPNAKVTLDKVVLANHAPFEGDTLFASEKITLNMSVKELFKDATEPIGIKSLMVDGAQLNIKVDENENANYDISKESSDDINTEIEMSNDGFTLVLESYAITNSGITYRDAASKMELILSDLQHSGSGDLSLETSELTTKTNALVSFAMDSAYYLKKNKISLDALIGIDLKQNKFSFLKNEALVNQLPLVFDGFVKINDDNQEVDINFKTPSSDFKNFLAVLPEEYSKDLSGIKTTGNFEVAGKFSGIVDETHIPKFNIKLNSNNASFKYPDLPKAVQQIFINAVVSNSSGIIEDTAINLQKVSFKIDEDKFNMTSTITNLLGNTKVKAHLDGKMNLANLSKAYPMPSELDLKGLLDANVNTAFDMASIEKQQYENTATSGQLNLKGFEYNSDEFANPIKISTTALTFNPKTVSLDNLDGTTGKTDFKASGTIDNLLGFMFNDENVEGNFKLSSNMFALNDFMSEEVSNETTENKELPVEEKLKIPSFLDCNITANANTVLYDNLKLKDVAGSLRIKDEKAVLNNMTTSLFDGKLAFNGEVSTKAETPTFAMKLGMDSFKIGKTFKTLELFKVLAPIANMLRGKLNSDIEISGSLKDDFTPNLGSISGNVLAELISTDLSTSDSKLLTTLSDKLGFLELNKLNLKNLKTALSFEDGKVSVKPFIVNYDDIAVNVSGGHSFDQKMNYTATVNVPAKYLGTEVSKLIAKIDDTELKELTVPVTATIGGNFLSPTVNTDLKSSVKNLTTQLIAIEKEKLVAKGKDAAKDLIGDILAKNNTKKDSTADKNGVKEVLGSLLGGSTKQKDSVTTKSDSAAINKKDAQKKIAKDVLNGLFKKKKKKDTVK